MGSDLALDLSEHSCHVVLKDLSQELLTRSHKRIERQYKYIKMTKRDVFSCPLDEILSRITFTTSYDNFGDVDIVIENITEDLGSKERVYQDLQQNCGEQVIYGVDTSCIPITRIASGLPVPENVIGMHFFNPVPLKTIVEVIKGYHTSEETIARTKEFLGSFGKKCIVVNDSPGFVSNRVLMMTINECIWIVQDKVASPADVDTLFKNGFGHAMGPLATADLIGLDTILNSLIVLHENYLESKFRPCPLLQKMVDAGLLGRKSGKGFFEYATLKK